jgi:hypothetical protein
VKRYWKWAVAQWDRVIGWTCVGGGAVLTLSGALSVSSAEDQLDQLSYLASGPAIGLFLLGVGAILVLTADQRDEWRKLDEVVSLLRQAGTGDSPEPTAAPAHEISLPDTGAVAVRAGFPAMAVAGVGILGGAAGVNQSLDQASALRWTQLSAGSLALVLVAAAFLHLRGRRAIALGVAGVAAAVAGPSRSRPSGSGSSGSGSSGSGADTPDGGWYVVEGSQRYHAAGCDLLRFSEVRPIPADGATGSSLTRCPICR